MIAILIQTALTAINAAIVIRDFNETGKLNIPCSVSFVVCFMMFLVTLKGLK